MKNVFVAMSGLLILSCGAAPAETAWHLRAAGIMCDRLHECLNTPEMKAIPFSFYLGNNAGDCRAALDEALFDINTIGTYGDRKFDQAAADTCSDAIQKLPCEDVKQFASNRIDTSGGAGTTGELKDTAFKDARARLGVATDFSCAADATTCRASPYCSLSTPTGPCALYKYAPLKDANLAAKEAAEIVKPEYALTGCGNMPGGF